MTFRDIANFVNAGLTDEQIAALVTVNASEEAANNPADNTPNTDNTPDTGADEISAKIELLTGKLTELENKIKAANTAAARQPEDVFRPPITADDVITKIINGGK